MAQKKIVINPIGTVNADQGTFTLQIDEPYRAGLKQLGHYSHVHVLWWADQSDTPQYRSTLTCYPPYAEDVLTGVFACRAEYRPNPILMTTCTILDVNEDTGQVQVAWIDAFDGTAILDLKPFMPVSDRPQEFKMPDWLAHWPEWIPTGYWSPESAS